MPVIVKNWNATKVLKKLESQTKQGTIALGRAIRDEAKQLCPKDTKRLAASITVNWSGSNKGRAKSSAIPGGTTSLYGTKVLISQRTSLENDGVGEPAAEAGKFIVVIGSNVDYAPYVEQGTARTAPQPFLRPAVHKYAAFFTSKMSLSFFSEGYD